MGLMDQAYPVNVPPSTAMPPPALRKASLRVGDKWLCVVVKYTADDAFVLTAYLTDKLKKGEQLWPTK